MFAHLRRIPKNKLVDAMNKGWFLGWIGLILAGSTMAVAPATPSIPLPLVPSSEARVASPTVIDTVEYRVPAGSDLIAALPGTLTNRTVTGYRILRAPSMSWLVDRSLLWRTQPADAGPHALLVEAAFANAAADTLTVLIEVGE